MVLFTEDETLLLLDLYLGLRARPHNAASNGVLLKAPARVALTRAINVAGARDPPLTESQVFVKFKNLRNEYALVKWLEEQPGFKRNSDRLSDEWWANIKAARPKAHVFKGRLPWPFFRKMAMILLDAPAVPPADPRVARRVAELLGESQSTPEFAAEPTTADSAPLEIEAAAAEQTEQPAVAAPASNIGAIPTAAKRSREPNEQPIAPKRRPERTERAAPPDAGQFERRESLTKSVEQCSAAAAGMARGFQELVSVFQHQSQKCRRLEASGAPEDVVSGQRHVLLSIAKSLEQSTQATADMAKGYHDLVQHFIQDADARQHARE